MPFEEHLPKTVPPPFQAKWGKRFFQGTGRRLDAIVQLVRDAGGINLPTPDQDGDALEEIGRERQIPRGSSEVDADFAAYLATAWEVWAGDNTPGTGVGGGAGTPLGLLNAIKRAGLPIGPDGATIVYQNKWWARLDVDNNLEMGVLMDCVNRLDLGGITNPRPGWTFDGRDNFYSVFGIVFPTDASIDGAVLNAIVMKWRPSKALYIGAWVIGPSSSTLGWPLGRTLGTEPNLGGNTITFVPPTGDDTRIGYRFIG